MKKYLSDTARPCSFSHDIIFRIAAVLALLTMLSIWLVSGLFAKYTVNDSSSNSARVAAFGSVEVKEHKAKPKTVGSSDVRSVYYSGEYADMLYELDLDDEVDSNTYDVMMPGVDIPKDPFVRVTTGEVDCELYIKIVEKNIPEEYQDRNGETHKPIVTYTVDPSIWQKLPDNQQDGNGVIYKYSSVIDANSAEQKISILKDNKICISQYYDADGLYNAKAPESDDFSLTFSAWLVQAD